MCSRLVKCRKGTMSRMLERPAEPRGTYEYEDLSITRQVLLASPRERPMVLTNQPVDERKRLRSECP